MQMRLLFPLDLPAEICEWTLSTIFQHCQPSELFIIFVVEVVVVVAIFVIVVVVVVVVVDVIVSYFTLNLAM